MAEGTEERALVGGDRGEEVEEVGGKGEGMRRVGREEGGRGEGGGGRGEQEEVEDEEEKAEVEEEVEGISEVREGWEGAACEGARC